MAQLHPSQVTHEKASAGPTTRELPLGSPLRSRFLREGFKVRQGYEFGLRDSDLDKARFDELGRLIVIDEHANKEEGWQEKSIAACTRALNLVAACALHASAGGTVE